MNNKNLIIGIAANYNRFDIIVFIESVRKTGCLAEIVLFETNFTPDCYQYCTENNVTTVNINSAHPWFKEEHHLQQLRKLHSFVNFPAHFIRFFLIDSYLKCHNCYSNIIISDVRDVFFQEDPFKGPFNPNEIYCYLESEALTIAQEPINEAWVRNGYYEVGLMEIKDDFISCCGVVVGDSDAIRRYVKVMCDEFERLADAKVEIGFDGVMEQACHNYLLRKGKFNPVNIVSDDAGLVSTLSYFKPISDIFINADKQITNLSGKIIPIIHQYDRFPKFDRMLQHKLSFKSNLYYFVSKKAKWMLPLIKWIF